MANRPDVITAWRISSPRYADSMFSGEGARRFGGRFNSVGQAVVYAASSLSLALLESLVQSNDRQLLAGYVFASANVPASSIEHLRPDDLPPGWDSRPISRVSQALGDAWLMERRSLVLAVPSVVLPIEINYLINPAHPDFPGVSFSDFRALPFDERLA